MFGVNPLPHPSRPGAAGSTLDEHVDADFVVDGPGRGSPVGGWLVAAGWPALETQTLDARVTYTSRWYELPAQRPPTACGCDA